MWFTLDDGPVADVLEEFYTSESLEYDVGNNICKAYQTSNTGDTFKTWYE